MKSIVNNVECLGECLEQSIEQMLEEDTITIHLGRKLSEEKFGEVVASILDFMDSRWPDLCRGEIVS